jgi:predicted aspartyl protease
MNAMVLWMLLAAPAAAADTPPVTQFEAVSGPTAISRPDQSAELAMTSDVFERMTVPVRLGGSGPFRFLVDTGSSRTSVSSLLARQLGLAEGQRATLHSSTGPSQVRMAFLPELQLGRRSVHRIAAPMLEAHNIGADGILGIDSLRSQRVLFDFANGTLSILTGEAQPRVEEGAIVVRARRLDGRLVITDAQVDGERVSVVIDTGSALTVGNAALRRKLERRGGFQINGATDLVSVTGETLRGELAKVGAIEIGGARLEAPTIAFARAHTFTQLRLEHRPALLLGMDTLRAFDQVSIDFARKRVLLVLPRERKRA